VYQKTELLVSADNLMMVSGRKTCNDMSRVSEFCQKSVKCEYQCMNIFLPNLHKSSPALKLC